MELLQSCTKPLICELWRACCECFAECCQCYKARSLYCVMQLSEWHVNTLGPRQNGRHFADDTFNRIFVNENVRISIKFSLKFVPKGSINNIPALVQIMAWRRPGDKPLSGPMMVRLQTHICVTRPQWVNSFERNFRYAVFKRILVLDGWGISCEIALVWMSLDFTDDQSTLVQVMAWWRQATSHYLSQCWPRSLSAYGFTRPQRVNCCLSLFPAPDNAGVSLQSAQVHWQDPGSHETLRKGTVSGKHSWMSEGDGPRACNMSEKYWLHQWINARLWYLSLYI